MTAENTQTARLLTAKQSATYLAISERKLWSISKSGDIPTVRLGRCVRYDKADLDEFIQRAKTGGGNGS